MTSVKQVFTAFRLQSAALYTEQRAYVFIDLRGKFFC